MGIHGLMKLLSEEAPDSIKELDGFAPLTGRKVAIDASMAMYQFLVAVRTGQPGGAAQLTNEAGDVTSHIQGMFNRTIKMMEAGIKPCYVFDGKPPNLKSGELAKRIARRQKAEKDLADAKASGADEDVDRFQRRLVKVTRQHNLECQQLLTLMGVPFIAAPGEAEAQCAELAKHGKVYATATEDMDALTFRTPKLLRKLTFSQSSKDKTQPILEIDVEKVLTGLRLSYEEFVDLCILCGCDYSDSIKGIGPKGALKLIRDHHTIEAVVQHVRRNDKKKEIPLDWKEQKVSRRAMEAAEKMQEEMRKAKEEKELQEAKDRAERLKQEAAIAAAAAAAAPDLAATGADAEAGAAVAGFSSGRVDPTELATEVSLAPAETSVSPDDEKKAAANMAADEELEVALVDSDDEGESKPEGEPEAEAAVDPVEEEELEIDEDDVMVIPPLFVQARRLFLQAEVTPASELDLKWQTPDVEPLRVFLVDKMGFNPERVQNNINRLVKAQQTKSQQRMDSFFSVVGTSTSSGSAKRKAAEAASMKKGKAAKGKTASKKGGFRR